MPLARFELFDLIGEDGFSSAEVSSGVIEVGVSRRARNSHRKYSRILAMLNRTGNGDSTLRFVPA